MAEINNRFRVKKGLDVLGDTSLTGNLDVTGVITVPTQAASENSNKAATTQFVQTAIANLVASAPGTLNTLNELATALGDDPNFATTMTNQLALKAPLASPALTGTPTAPTPATADSSSLVATTQYVKNQLYATLASPALSGIPTSPTPGLDTNTTQIATAAFVLAQAGDNAPLMAGVASAGTSTRWSRQDHVHPIDTTRAPLISPALTGTPTAPTATFGDNSTLIANTAYVKAALAAAGIGGTSAPIPGATTATIDDSTIPTGLYYVTSTNTGTMPPGDTYGHLLVGREAAGLTAHQLYMDNTTSRMWSRAWTTTAWTAWREVAFTDSPAFTGVPTVPTAAPNTNSTQAASTAYADAIAALKANIANPAFTGNMTVTGGGLSTGDFACVPFPSNGNYTTSAASVTGSVKIKLPVAYTGTQISFDVNLNEATTDSALRLRVSGMNRGDSTWQFVTAYVAGGVASRIPNVRFGNDGTTCCVWVGELADVWTTPQIQITNVTLGNTGLSASWLSGWAVSYVTTFDTVKTGPITPNKAAGLASPVFTGAPTVPTPAANDNSSVIPNTSWVNAAIAASGSTSIITKNLTSTAVTLTAAEYSNSMIVFTGALTGNTTVTVPNTAHAFIAANNTTGSYTLTIKSAGMTPSVQVVQNKANSLYCDTTGVYATSSTTGVQFAKQFNITSSTALDLSYLGSIVVVTTAGVTITLPLANGYPAGAGVFIHNLSNGNITVVKNGSGSDTGEVALPLTMLPNDGYFLTSDNVSKWLTSWYSNPYTPSFKTSVSAPVALFGGATDNGIDKLQVTGTGSVSGTFTAGGAVTGTSANGALVATNGTGAGQTSVKLTRVGGPTDQKSWELLQGSDGSFGVRTVNDAYSAAQYALAVYRSTSFNLSYLQLMPTGGNVVVGTNTDNGVDKLQVNGTIKSLTGGFVFPDGTTQTTANGVTAPNSVVYTPAAAATSITTGGYNLGFVQVFKNNLRLIPTIDFTATDGVTVQLTTAATGRDRYEVLTSVVYSPSAVFAPVSKTFTLGVGQSVMTVNYNVSCLWVFKNNLKLLPADYTATNGTSITLTNVSDSATDVYEVVTFTAFAANGMLPLTGGTMTGGITQSTGAADSTNYMNTNAGYYRDTVYQTSGSTRWVEGVDNGAEPGSNVGANWFVSRYADNGTVIDNPLYIYRNTGLVTLSQGLVMPDGFTQTQTQSGRNRITNGSCRVTQRGAGSYGNGVSGYSGVDMFTTNNTAGGVFTQTSGSITYNSNLRKAVVQTVTTTGAAFTTTNLWLGIQTRLEGQQVHDFLNGYGSLSFIWNTNVTGTFSIQLFEPVGGNSYVTTFSATANTPTRVTIPAIPFPSSLGIPNTNALGLLLSIGSITGPSYQTATLNAWQTGNLISASGATNWATTNGNFIALTELQLEPGKSCTPFEQIHPQTEFAQCQRYYEVVPFGGFVTYNQTTTVSLFNVPFNTQKRVGPSLNYSLTGNTYENCPTAGQALSIDRITPNVVMINLTGTGGGAAGTCGRIIGGSPAYMAFSAEL
jgi:hypothetical protein